MSSSLVLFVLLAASASAKLLFRPETYSFADTNYQFYPAAFDSMPYFRRIEEPPVVSASEEAEEEIIPIRSAPSRSRRYLGRIPFPINMHGRRPAYRIREEDE